MKQHEAVIQTIEKLGGAATLAQLNQEVYKIRECRWQTKTPFASIRRIVQTRSEIYKIKPGLYGLHSFKKRNEARGLIEATPKNKTSPELLISDHYYYQGLLLMLGNLKKFGTFAPHQDKNRTFLNQTLDDLRSIKQMPNFSYPYLIKRSQTIDVIWFNQRVMPDSFFEVESSTDILNSLSKYQELQDFYVRMFIVSDKMRKAEFDHKVSLSSFEDIKPRVRFLDYEAVVKQYELAVAYQQFEILI
jgi:hypothetical protein